MLFASPVGRGGFFVWSIVLVVAELVLNMVLYGGAAFMAFIEHGVAAPLPEPGLGVYVVRAFFLIAATRLAIARGLDADAPMAVIWIYAALLAGLVVGGALLGAELGSIWGAVFVIAALLAAVLWLYLLCAPSRRPDFDPEAFLEQETRRFVQREPKPQTIRRAAEPDYAPSRAAAAAPRSGFGRR